MSVELFAPGTSGLGQDIQQPHAQDELYVVQRGQSEFVLLGERSSVLPGDVLFVPAGAEHRFENFSADFTTWVIFMPHRRRGSMPLETLLAASLRRGQLDHARAQQHDDPGLGRQLRILASAAPIVRHRARFWPDDFAGGLGAAHLAGTLPADLQRHALGGRCVFVVAGLEARQLGAAFGERRQRHCAAHGLFAAAAFQWINPKAWVMAVTAISTLPAQAQPLQIASLAALFTALNLPCVATWGAFGSAMRRILQDPKRLRVFNTTMALALVAFLIPMLA